MIVIGISGKAEHGKTFTANLLKERYKSYKVEIIPLAKTLKEMAKKVGWDGEKDAKGRTLLQDLGKVLKVYHGGDCFARWAYKIASDNNLDILLIDDIRMLDEVKFFEDLSNQDIIEKFILIRVNRSNYENSLTEEQRNDISETALDNYIFNYTMNNSGDDKYIEFLKDIEFN